MQEAETPHNVAATRPDRELLPLRDQHRADVQRDTAGNLREARFRAVCERLKLNKEEEETVKKSLKALDRKQNPRTNSDNSTSPIDMEKVRQAIDELRDVGHWPLPSLAEWRGEPVKEVQIIVHPCFSIFDDAWDPRVWESVGKNPEKYIEHFVLSMANAAKRAVSEDPTSLPLSYFCARDLIEELDALRSAPPEGSLRILDLPRRSMTKDDGRREFLDALVGSMPKQNTVVVDSETQGSGELQPTDVRRIGTLLETNAHVTLQGGYINACLDGACKSVTSGLRNRQDISFDVDGNASTGTNVASSVPIHFSAPERQKKIEEVRQQSAEYPGALDALIAFDRTRLKSPERTEDFSSMDDVRRWIAMNNDVNDAYDAFIRVSAQKTTREETGTDIHYR
jgi:hypothetical protein